MKHEHTPGPWVRSGWSIRALDHRGINIARTAANYCSDVSAEQYQSGWSIPEWNEGGPPEAEATANARLIAKAPLLLKILEGFLATLDTDDLEEEAVSRSHYNTHIGLWNAAIDAHKAITRKEES